VPYAPLKIKKLKVLITLKKNKKIEGWLVSGQNGVAGRPHCRLRVVEPLRQIFFFFGLVGVGEPALKAMGRPPPHSQ